MASRFPRPGDKAYLVVPAGARGPGFLMLQNFRAIMKYNPAEAYALAIGHLSDRFRGDPPFMQSWPRDERVLVPDRASGIAATAGAPWLRHRRAGRPAGAEVARRPDEIPGVGRAAAGRLCVGQRAGPVKVAVTFSAPFLSPRLAWYERLMALSSYTRRICRRRPCGCRRRNAARAGHRPVLRRAVSVRAPWRQYFRTAARWWRVSAAISAASPASGRLFQGAVAEEIREERWRRSVERRHHGRLDGGLSRLRSRTGVVGLLPRLAVVRKPRTFSSLIFNQTAVRNRNTDWPVASEGYSRQGESVLRGDDDRSRRS